VWLAALVSSLRRRDVVAKAPSQAVVSSHTVRAKSALCRWDWSVWSCMRVYSTDVAPVERSAVRTAFLAVARRNHSWSAHSAFVGLRERVASSGVVKSVRRATPARYDSQRVGYPRFLVRSKWRCQTQTLNST